VQLRCYWKQLWSRWAITGSWEPLVFFHRDPVTLNVNPLVTKITLENIVIPGYWSITYSTRCLRPFYVVHQYISCTIHHNDAVCNDAIGIIIRRCPGPIRYPCAICDRPVARNHYVLNLV
jgi:hypothetical protein